MTTATERTLQQRLGGGSLDRKFVDELGKNLKMDYNFEYINDINMLIREMYNEHIDKFISQYEEQLVELGVDIEELRTEMQDSIYTNYLDSGLDYENENEEVQKLIDEYGEF